MSFIEFIKSKDPSFSWNWHHIAICNQIDKWLESKDNYNLMILSPPNSSKSTISALYLPLYLRLYYNYSVLVVNRSNDIAMHRRRSFVRQLSYDEHPDFRTSFIGVGDSMVGLSYDMSIIDDINITTQNFESINKWYESTITTRMKSNSKQLIISTYVKNGLIDYIINKSKKQSTNKWTTIRIPGIIQPIVFDLNNPEQSYWENRYSIDYLKKIRDSISPEDWNTLYQQQI